jgi:hypothetical protein
MEQLFSRGYEFVKKPDGRDGNWLIRIDADAATGIPTTYDWERGLTDDQRADLLRQGPGFPYALRRGAKTLIIGRAADTMSRVRWLRAAGCDRCRDQPADRQQDHAGSHGEREPTASTRSGSSSVCRRRPLVCAQQHGKYQVLQATLVDTWASTAAGAFALVRKQPLYVGCLLDYLSHLTGDGMLAFTRWGFEPPRESLRLVSLAMDALARLGESDPASHVIAVRDDATKINGWGAQDTVLVSRKPFSAADLENARRRTGVDAWKSCICPCARSE